MFLNYSITHIGLVEKKYSKELKQLGIEIVRLRKERSLTQKELAFRCDIDERSIQRIEKGDQNVSFSNLLAIAKVLEVKASELVESAESAELSK